MSRSERVYRVLLLAYPREFRRDCGTEMVQVFGDLCREEMRRGGALGLVRVWARTLPDLVATAFAERSSGMRDRWLFTLVPLALSFGLAIAYVDSSPGWDDTGVSAAAVLGTSGLFGVLYPARPWLWALAVGFGSPRTASLGSSTTLPYSPWCSPLRAPTRGLWCARGSFPFGDLR